jgi:uncharacterized protein YjbJ (UPF0337 family)
MQVNENIIKGKWLEIKGDIRKAWGNLTDDDLEKTKGDMAAIGGLLQQKYGATQESYSHKLGEIFKRFSEKADDAVEGIKDKLKS